MTSDENLSTSSIIDEIVKEASEKAEDSEADAKMDPLEERQTREALYSPEVLEEMRVVAEEKKAAGNEEFGKGNWAEALTYYDDALETCPLIFSEERATYLANRAAAYMKQDLWEKAIEDCTEAIKLGPKNNKALARRAICYTKDDKDLDKAIEDYKKLAELEPTNRTYQSEISILEKRVAERNEKLKEEMFGQMKKLGNMFLKPFGLSTDNFQLEPQPGGGYSVNMKK
uniref:TPR_REGION domain-containing protein n=1 Tax=Steinernema glaseri TaxID=37863 RepID=A0A1I7YAV7_9BILA